MDILLNAIHYLFTHTMFNGATTAWFIPAAMLAGSVIQGLGNFFGNKEQAKASDNQLNQSKEFMNRELAMRGQGANYLQSLMPQSTQALPDVNQYFGMGALDKYYNIGRQNLTGAMNQGVSDASMQAGALAGARGLANPSGFVSNSANQVRQSFAPQFGALEQSRAGAQNNQLQALYQALMQQRQYQDQSSQNRFQNELGIQNFRLG